MTEKAFEGDDAVPKSYIRKIFKGIIDNPDSETDDILKAADLLAKLEGYTSANGTGTRDAMKKGVRIVQTSMLGEKTKPPILRKA